MIDSLLNLLFRCSHRRLTRPITPVNKAGLPHGATYVVCLDCGKQFEYDVARMEIGRPIDHSHEGAVVPPPAGSPRNAKVKYAVLAALPATLLLGALLQGRKKRAAPAPKDESEGRAG